MANFRADNNESNDVIIHIGDVDTLDSDADIMDPPAGLAATVVRRAIEIDLDTAVDVAFSSSSSSSSPTSVTSPSSMASSMTSSSSSSSRRIPRTSARRLALTTPDVCPDEPVLASKYQVSEKTPLLSPSSPSFSPATEPTVLYLAYGSNMAASTFEGTRRIKPLSCVTVSAPTLQLTFDLPGLPYREPCFANTAFRKVPKTPPKIPDVPPLPAPPGPPGPPVNPPPSTSARVSSHGDPIWDGPLYGVVYEVTRDDYARIIATEGGGASYQDVLVPCLTVAPRMGVPEKPTIPVPVRPFLAHTLFAPLIPALNTASGEAARGDGGDGDNGDDNNDGDDDDGGGDDDNWLTRRWRHAVRALVRYSTMRGRPDPGYAQPSRRYLGLLTTGAAEHELPEPYQEWLASLQPYTVTTWRQTIGSVLLLACALPFLLVALSVNWLPSKKGSSGRMSPWMMVAIGTIFRSVWWVYDHVFRPVFGDGERTETKEGDKRRGGG